MCGAYQRTALIRGNTVFSSTKELKEQTCGFKFQINKDATMAFL